MVQNVKSLIEKKAYEAGIRDLGYLAKSVDGIEVRDIELIQEGEVPESEGALKKIADHLEIDYSELWDSLRQTEEENINNLVETELSKTKYLEVEVTEQGFELPCN